MMWSHLIVLQQRGHDIEDRFEDVIVQRRGGRVGGAAPGVIGEQRAHHIGLSQVGVQRHLGRGVIPETQAATTQRCTKSGRSVVRKRCVMTVWDAFDLDGHQSLSVHLKVESNKNTLLLCLPDAHIVEVERGACLGLDAIQHGVARTISA